jgi:hypothetical protein
VLAVTTASSSSISKRAGLVVVEESMFNLRLVVPAKSSPLLPSLVVKSGLVLALKPSASRSLLPSMGS